MDTALHHINNGGLLAGMSRLAAVLNDARSKSSPPEWREFIATQVLPHEVREVLPPARAIPRALRPPRSRRLTARPPSRIR